MQLDGACDNATCRGSWSKQRGRTMVALMGPVDACKTTRRALLVSVDFSVFVARRDVDPIF